jgi:heme/copper-type cytochrome/quinol oxidase subunit 3
MATLVARPARASRQLTIVLTLTFIVAGIFWAVAVTPYFRNHREGFGPAPEVYWDRRYGLWIHILGGSVALFTGPIQLWLGETRQRLALHRTLGMAYLGGVAVSCLAAYYLSFTTPVGLIFAGGLFGLALASTITTSMAWVAIRYRNFVQHREWMIRSYVTIFAFVLFRLLLVTSEMFRLGGDGPAASVNRLSLVSWVCWAFPMLLTEMALQWPKLRPAR